MAFQVFIKNNLKDDDHFSSGKRYDFTDDKKITIGSSEQADCPITESEIADTQVIIECQQNKFYITAQKGCLVFLNDKPLDVSLPYEIRTGDEIRMGHWICRFHKILPKVKFSHQALLLSRIVKISVVIIIVLELLVILTGSTWVSIVNERSSLLSQAQRHHYLSQQLDAINNDLKALAQKTDFSPLEAATCRAITSEITKIRSYVLEHGIKISNDNLLQIQRLTMDYQVYVSKLKERTLISPIENLQLEQKLNDLLKTPQEKNVLQQLQKK